ncbi:MAG: class I SAM-dependent methyltransferase [Chloroflexota bacterium]
MRYQLRYTPSGLSIMAAPGRVKEGMLPPDFPRLFESQHTGFDEDLPLWLALAAEAHGPILELGCGPGRVLATLAKAGYDVEGLDYDPEMLARAAQRLAPYRVPLHCADLCSLTLKRRFALILLPCNTFAQLNDEEAMAMLAGARRHLTCGGRLAAELPHPRESAPLPGHPDEPLTTFFEAESGNPVQLYAYSTLSPDGRRVDVLWHYDELHPDGHVTRTSVGTTFYIRRPRELRRMLKQTGFASVHFFGNYDRSRYTPRARRLIVLAQAS